MRKSGRNYLSDVRQPMTLLITASARSLRRSPNASSIRSVVFWQKCCPLPPARAHLALPSAASLRTDSMSSASSPLMIRSESTSRRTLASTNLCSSAAAGRQGTAHRRSLSRCQECPLVRRKQSRPPMPLLWGAAMIGVGSVPGPRPASGKETGPLFSGSPARSHMRPELWKRSLCSNRSACGMNSDRMGDGSKTLMKSSTLDLKHRARFRVFTLSARGCDARCRANLMSRTCRRLARTVW